VARLIAELGARDRDPSPSVWQRRELARRDVLVKRRPPEGTAPRAVDVPRADLVLPGSDGARVPVRAYLPHAGAIEGDVIVYLHGGGWVVGDLDMYDPDVALLAEITGLVCVSVGYRLAPENPYPAALEDLAAVVRELVSRPEVASVSLAGDSAGGGLALAMSLLARDTGVPIFAQLLIYPAIDPDAVDSASYRTNGSGYLLDRDDMTYFYDAYLPPSSRDEVYGAPARATDVSGLPPTIVVSAGYDPLVDEGRRLVDRLRSAGVAVDDLTHPTLVHGFQQMVERVPAARLAICDAYERFARLVRFLQTPTFAGGHDRPREFHALLDSGGT
jgi:acetyl esterase